MADEELEVWEGGDEEDEGRSLTEPDPDVDYSVTRTSRRVRFHIAADVEIEVVEPPNVPDMQIKSYAKRAVFSTLSRLDIGVPTNISVEVRRRGCPDD
jgi:hypothetical protein